MNFKKAHICRLCLKVAKNGFQEIDDTMKQLFDILLLKLDLDLTRDPIICQHCAEVVKKCLNFKSLCIDREKIILSFSAGERKSKQSTQIICAEEEQVVIVNEEDIDICRFCMSRMEIKNNFMLLNTSLNDTVFEVITKYMPEMDFNVPEDPIVCITCIDNLEGYSLLVLNCLETETKIKAYCKEGKSDNKNVIHLSSVLDFLFKDIGEDIGEYKIHKLKQESNRTKDTDDIYTEAYSGIIKQEILDVKDEEINLNESCSKNSSEIIKTHMLFDKDDSQTKTYRCSLCAYNAKCKSYLKRHMLVHKDVSEIKMHKCELCAYGTKRKNALKRHMVVHRDVSEIATFKCALCAYEAKRKADLKSHMLVHRDVSEIKMFRCALCAYESKRKSQLTAHMLVHKDVSEIDMFKCTSCVYESKTKSYLERHMLSVHQSEIKMYKCTLCVYEAKTKSYLEKHMLLVHKDVSGIKIVRCALCAYETNRKSSLNTHMLVHKDISEIKMFKCALCCYETKRKCHLASHMVIHKNVSKIEMYKCSLCTFQTKHKGALNRHRSVHT